MMCFIKKLMIAGLCLSPIFALGATWDGGTTGDYNTSVNWDPDGVPIADNAEILTNSDVTLGAAVGTTGILRVQNATGASLTVNAGGSLVSLNRILIGEAGGTTGTLDITGGDVRSLTSTGQNFVGLNGNGTLNIGPGASYRNSGGNNLVVAGNAGSEGTINVTGGTATFDNPRVLVVGRNGVGTVNLSSGEVEVNSAVYISNGTTGDGFVNVSGTGDFNASGAVQGNSLIGQGNGGEGTLDVTDDGIARFSSANVVIGNNDGAVGTVSLSGNAQFTNGNQLFVGNAGTSKAYVTIDDNASLTSTGVIYVGFDDTSEGRITQNGGSLESVNSNLVLGRQGSGKGTYILNDGSVSAANTLYVGRDNTTVGVFEQSGGNVIIGNQVAFGLGANGTGTYTMTGGTLTVPNINAPGDGHFLLNAGTLKVDNINANLDSFTWGAGTLASKQLADFNDISVGFDLTTSAGSILELGSVYISGVLDHETLDVAGALNLNAPGDTLNAIGSVQFLRPVGTGLSIAGTVPLITATSLSGVFDTFTAPSGGNVQESLFDPLGNPNALSVNTWWLEYDEINGEVNFLYRLSGTAPEPTTVSLIGVAAVLLRTLRRKQVKFQD